MRAVDSFTSLFNSPPRIPGAAGRAAILLIGLGVVGCGGGNVPPGHVGGTMPEYSAHTLGGEEVSLGEEFAGRPVLLNLWATWCPPCRHEIPELNNLHHELADRGLVVVGVSIDSRGSETQVRDFLDEFAVAYPILHDPDGRINRLVQAIGLPTTLLIDREGTIQWRRTGPVTADDADLRDALENVL